MPYIVLMQHSESRGMNPRIYADKEKAQDNARFLKEKIKGDWKYSIVEIEVVTAEEI